MKRINVFVFFVAVFSGINLFGQQGVHGPRIVNAANTVVNEYTAITAFTPAGSTSITVAASSLNANGRFAAVLQPGDLVMLYQAQGTIIVGPVSIASDTTWGRVDPGNYYSTGYYEFHQVVSVPNATTINIDCGTTYAYIQNGGTARKPEVIRVPRYTTLTINTGGVLTCDDWNGTIGGVLAVEVQGNTVINAGGFIDATGKGFRGGSLVGDNVANFGVNSVASTDPAFGAEKGESVSGYQAEYDPFGGRYGRGAPANGGGGGCAHNAGGGGGANAPNSTSGTALWSGNGIPDQTGLNWNIAWAIEPPGGTMNLRTSVNSAGGGRGGYTFSGSDQNAITTAPGNAVWGGDGRSYQSTGLGGRPMDYTTGRLFIGGGGGAGDQNNGGGGIGGDGGGLIYLMVFGNISGSGTVLSNGINGANGQGGTGFINGIDAGGGGGAGGTVVLNAVGGVANTITVNCNGGNGGNQVINFPGSTAEAEGPGGGGGGGYISVSSGAPTRTVNGGNNGTTNSSSLTEFTPNGATKGCPGTNNATITNFTITVNPITICVGNSVTLTAILSGTVPGGTVVDWYNSSVGGAPIATGLSYTTPALFVTTTYWVGTCPGWWRVPVTVTVAAAPVVTATASLPTICSGGSTTLTGGGAVTYVWNPGNISGSPIIVSPATTTTYTVTGTIVAGCSATQTVTVTVNPTPTVTATAVAATICSGASSTLTGGGATTYNWNPGNINGSPIVVSPASTTTYTVTGTSLGCSSTAQVTVTVNPSPTVTATAVAATICSGGSSTLTGSGASTYNWNPGNINGSPIVVSPVATTTYTVTGTALNGCTSTAQVTVTVNPTPTVTATAVAATICSGGSSTLTGGGATTYNWNPGNINGSPIVVTPASTTTYTVTGTTGSCSSTAQVTVTVNTTPTVTATAVAATICSGGSSTLTGGGASTYNWNPGNINGSPIVVSPATTTTYTVTGTAVNGCTSTAQVTVTVNPTPTVTATAVAPGICSGGSSTLTGGGATTYNWNPGNINGSPIVVSPAATTTYTVTGTSLGCSSTAQVTVTVSPTPTVTATAVAATICAGGSSTLTGGGATTYNWNPGNINGSPIVVTPATTTTYTVTGTTAGCSSTAQVTVTVNPSPTVTATAVAATICSGGSSTLTGGGALTYNWNPGNINGSPIVVSPAVTTTYTVTGTAANGCTSTQQVTVTVNPTPTVTASAVSSTICAGASSTLTGGGATTYNWNPGNINGSPIVVSPASTTTYTVTGTLGSCTNTAQVTVTVNPTPTVTATALPATICTGNSSTLTGGGASTYNWNPGNINGSPIVVSPATTTTYTVTGTALNGCTSTQQVTVTVNPTPTVTATAVLPTICAGGSSTLTGGGATSYNWNPGNINGSPIVVSPAVSTTYTVTGTLGTCTNTAQVTVTVNPTPTVTASSSATSICIGASATLSGTGASTYVWNPGNISGSPITVSPLVTTTYTVIGTDAFGCTSTAQVTVTVNPLPTPTASATPATLCVGQSTSLTANAGTAYVWNGGTLVNANGIPQNVSPVATTTYTVDVTDVNGCSASTQVTVTVNPLPVADAGIDQAICSGNGATILATGGGTYVWNGGALVNSPGASQSVSPIATTDYIVTVTNGFGCTDEDTISVVVNALPTTNAGPDVSICINSSIQLNASGAVSYSWSPATGLDFTNIPNPIANPVVTTTYVVTGTNAAGCTYDDTIVVILSNVLTVFAGADVTICNGDTVLLSTSGGVIYNWSPASSLQSPSSSSTNAFPSLTTTYTVNVTDANSCSGSDSITVFVNPPVLLSASGNSPICDGQSTSITAVASGGTAPYVYNWSNSLTGSGPQTVSPSTTTTYTVSITDSLGCTSPVQNITIIVNPNPVATLQSSSNVSCFGGSNGSATVNVTGGTPSYSYLWSPSGGTGAIGTGLLIGTYTCTITDSAGCTTTQSATITEPTAIQLTSSSTPENCSNADGSASVSASGGTPGYTFVWSNASVNDTITNLASGSYTVITTDANACVDSIIVSVGTTSGAVANAGLSVTITAGQSVVLNGSGGVTYSWSPPTGLNCTTCQFPNASPMVTTVYTLTVTDANGCTDSDTVTIFVEEPCGVVFVPNAFSPNGDNANDTFFVRGNCIEFMDFQIFNRWGEKVFSSTDPTKGWDGTWRGQACEVATFTYYLRAILLDGTEINKQGTISMVK